MRPKSLVPTLLPVLSFACVFRPLEGLPSPIVVVFCISDYFQVVGVSWGDPHDDAKKLPEQHFYVFQFPLGVRGRVFEVSVIPMWCFRPPHCCHFQGLRVFSALLRGFRPLLSSFPAYVITFRLWGSHGGTLAMRPKSLQNTIFTYSRSYWECVFFLLLVCVTPMRCFRPNIVASFEVCVCFLSPEVFRPLLLSFSVYAITVWLLVFHGGTPR